MRNVLRSKSNGRLTLWCCAFILCWIVWSAIHMQQVHAEAGAEAYTATVHATSLNVREEPAISATIIGSLKQGAEIQVLSEQFGWAEINFNSEQGWIAAHYLNKDPAVKTALVEEEAGKEEQTTASPSSEPESLVQATLGKVTGKVTADALRMRAEPDLQAEIIDLLPQSSALEISGQSGEWLEVTTADGQSGWVSGEFVALVEAGQSEPAPVATKPQDPPTPTPTKPRFDAAGLKNKRIVLDPGHGGSQPGTIGVKLGTLEKDLNLSTTKHVAEALKAAGAEVILTRDTDKFLDLSDRVEISQANKADVFISLHYNSGKANSRGIISFYYSEQRDKPLAADLQKALIAVTGMADGGDRFGNYHVLRNNTTPSVLLELGFLSNPKEEEAVNTVDYQRKVAEAVVQGLQQYFEPDKKE
ncbi:N-acetylmuramoyl-L-alanine amidase [Paenibacillus sp. J2TS4]|uniref:N-acetylmuramoyl-L-alanine amidase n=1 Tax=Paenibacillus sp. J2TS4 TaxID=2807194 RepID=UPI001B1F2887|nr:N-acetylmuramoyl-L-alanine amidase [Paenibacillus sp. J2TS4]GIP31950.1 hypothetical protein J2TS4_11600 [Paenibacillus sp. J2TS4]